MADIDSADIAPWFRPSFEFIEEARTAGTSVLVHCGAGVSRSAALCLAYLMRRNRWSAQKALDFVKGRRSLVNPNDGFWRSLCALEATLGITDRSDPNAFKGFHGADAQLPDLNILEPKVEVIFVPAGKAAAVAAAAAKVQAAAQQQGSKEGAGEEERQRREGDRERRRSRSRSGERERERERRRSRSRSRERERERRRSRSRDGGGRRSRHSRSRSRGRSRERVRKQERHRSPISSKDRRKEAGPAVDLQTTPGAVLEVKRAGQLLGHLAIALTRAHQECVFGRMPSCDVVLEHLSVSRQHAQLTADGAGHLFITDMGSGHGTNVDGAWIRANVLRQLSKGSVVQFGASTRQYIVKKLPDPVAGR